MARRTRGQWWSFQSTIRRQSTKLKSVHTPLTRRLRIEPLEDRRLLAVVTVDTLDDSIDFGDGVTSLREAIFATNLVGGADTIDFDPSLTSGGPATILLTQGELAITDDLEITGPGASLLTIDASGNDPRPGTNDGDGSRVFNIDDGNFSADKFVSIFGLTLTGGDLGSGLDGGAIRSREHLALTSSTVSGNSVLGGSAGIYSYGGGIYSRDGNLVVTDSTISGNSATNGGGGIGIYRASLTVAGSTISDNYAKYLGGGGILSRSGTVTMTGSTISNNTAGRPGPSSTVNGGGIHSFHTNMTLIGSTISGNRAAFDGGGIRAIYGNVSVTDSTISGNLGGGDGGGINFREGHLLVAGSAISGNSAHRFGGGIGIRYDGNVTVLGSTISGNSAAYGGGVGNAVGSIAVDNSTISSNTAIARSGGGIDNLAGLAVIRFSTVTDNFAAFGLGSGIASRGNAFAQTEVYSSIVAGNSNSDVDFVDGVTNTFRSSGYNVIGSGNAIGEFIEPGDFSGVADPLLGPLADNGGPTLPDGSKILTHALLPGSPAINAGDLTAVAGVGGVSEFDQRGGPFFGRVFNGRIDIGAFEYQAASDLNLVVDTLVDESDGNYALGDLSLREALLLANTYPSTDTIRFAQALSGGTILLTMGELAITDNTSIIGLGADLLTIDASGNDPTPDSTLDDGNTTNDSDGSRVFNIYDGSSATQIDVAITGLTLTGGDERGRGGAIYSLEILSVTGCTISGNLTGVNSNYEGGGIFNSGNLTVTASTISGNSTRGDGGGIRTVGSSSIVVVTDSTLSGNSAKVDGGAISNNSSSVTVTNSTLSGNSANGSGGAVWMFGGSLIVTDSTISNNSARSGGGVHSSFYYTSLTFTNSTISGNVAMNGSGGGILARGTLSVANSTISNNSAMGSFSSGGGISGSTVTITNSTISGNSASGSGSGISGSTVTVSNSTISGNSAGGVGGGISGSTVTVSNSTISGNSATDGGGIRSTTLTVLSNSTISDNSADDSGGGIVINAAGVLTVTGSTIRGNSALVGGGISSFGTLVVTDSTLHGNAAGVGGGIRQFNGSLTITGSTISGNTAAGNGGGLYLFTAGSSEFTVRHSTIVSNTASGLGGGISVFGGSLNLDHTILAQNTAALGRDLVPFLAALIDARFNLIGDNANSGLVEAPVGSPDASGNLVGGPIHGAINPQLGPLGSNGGTTMTHVLLVGSPAIDVGDPSAVAGGGTVPEFDQRGLPFARDFGARIDIGAFERQAALGALIVDTLVDESDADYSAGDLSLREAIELANGYAGSDTVTFAGSLTGGGPATITLTHGELKITDALTIDGPGANLLTIDASGNDPTPDSTFQDGDSTNDRDGSLVFHVDDGNSIRDKNVTIAGLTITGGDATIGGGANNVENLTVAACTLRGNAAFYGGAIAGSNLTITGSRIEGNSAAGIAGIAATTLTLIDSVVSNNFGVGIRSARANVIRSTISGNSGTGLYAFGNFGDVVTIIDSTISNNSGGGIYLYRPALTVSGSTITSNSNGGGINVRLSSFTLENSTVSGNSAVLNGGGIRGYGTVTNSTISNNTAGRYGGGAYGSFSTFTNTTISGNRAGLKGGGVWGVNSFKNSTITGNVAGVDGGGVHHGLSSLPLEFNHSIVAGNVRGAAEPSDVATANATFIYSLFGVNTGATFSDNGGNLIGTAGAPIDPLLGPLANNGGPTMTHALLPGSPAIDAGDPAAVAGMGGVPLYDQRGAPFGRVSSGRIDIGAFELQPIPAAFYGDYNHNGVVDLADYAVWRHTRGSSVAPYGGADGNGSGTVDEADYAVWRSHFGQTLPVETGSGASASEALTTDVVPQPPARPGVGATSRADQASWFGANVSHSKPPAEPGTGSPTRNIDHRHDAALVAWLASRGVGRANGDQLAAIVLTTEPIADPAIVARIHSLDVVFERFGA